MTRLIGDDARGGAIRSAIVDSNYPAAFDDKEIAGLEYAARLTAEPATLSEGDVQRLRDAGFDDGEILELNQVAAYFAYANRMVLGLGIDTEGDIIGLSPGDSSDPDNWSHR